MRREKGYLDLCLVLSKADQILPAKEKKKKINPHNGIFSPSPSTFLAPNGA